MRESRTMNVNQIVMTNVPICSFDPVICDVDRMFGRRLMRGCFILLWAE